MSLKEQLKEISDQISGLHIRREELVQNAELTLENLGDNSYFSKGDRYAVVFADGTLSSYAKVYRQRPAAFQNAARDGRFVWDMKTGEIFDAPAGKEGKVLAIYRSESGKVEILG